MGFSVQNASQLPKVAYVRLMWTNGEGVGTMPNLVDQDIQELIECLHLPEDEILERFSFSHEGEILSNDNAIQFLQFLKTELSKECS